MWALLTSIHSVMAICIVGEFNEIPWKKIGDKDHYGPGIPGKRLAGLDDLPNRFCAVGRVGLGLHLASEDLCCISTYVGAT